MLSRPDDHPELARMEAVRVKLNEESDKRSVEELVSHVAGLPVEVLCYVAENHVRSTPLEQQSLPVRLMATASWTEGFLCGVLWQQQRRDGVGEVTTREEFEDHVTTCEREACPVEGCVSYRRYIADLEDPRDTCPNHGRQRVDGPGPPVDPTRTRSTTWSASAPSSVSDPTARTWSSTRARTLARSECTNCREGERQEERHLEEHPLRRGDRGDAWSERRGGEVVVLGESRGLRPGQGHSGSR